MKHKLIIGLAVTAVFLGGMYYSNDENIGVALRVFRTEQGGTGLPTATPGYILVGNSSSEWAAVASTSIPVADSYILNTGDTGTGGYDFGGASWFEIPNGAAPSVATTGVIAIDTTGSSTLIFYSGTDVVVLNPQIIRTLGSIGSTTQDRDLNSFDTATTTWSLGHANGTTTIHSIYGDTDTGTCKMRIGDGTNWSGYVTADSDGQELASLTNNTFTDREEAQLQIGQCASNPDFVTPTIMQSFVRE